MSTASYVICWKRKIRILDLVIMSQNELIFSSAFLNIRAMYSNIQLISINL